MKSEPHKSEIDSGGPYKAERVGPYGWYCVTDRVGNNVLSYGDGRVFCEKHQAELIAEDWNKNE